ncbi:MAG: sensor domain-containing diguanylate cyclase [Deltaproteobacteria bacterium]|nr:sensor domain-containing diguanylate cyclase [Candidatus Anaeroferrophillus wilburensis]
MMMGPPLGYFINSIYFEPLNYYIFAIAKTVNSERNISRIMGTRKKEAISAVGLSFLLGLSGTLVVMIFLFFYLKSITANINEITRSIDGLSSGKNTDISLKPKNEDEIGTMIQAFNNYVQRKINLEKFKQLIEEDENIHDVYSRIFHTLEQSRIGTYAFYEVNHGKNQIVHVKPDLEGETLLSDFSMPCSEEIMVNADACRAKRLAQIVAGDCESRVCPKFLGYGAGRKHLCIPIIIGGTAGEIVHITIHPDDESHVKRQTPILLEYFRNAAPVIESKKLLENLRETTLRDNLTGLNNRRFLEEYIELLVAEAAREQKQLGILMADLDHFKKVNDVHGHQAGDKVLKMLAKVMRASVRSSDIVVRYGGEEFLIITKSSKAEEDVLIVAEKVRQQVENHEMKVSPTVTLQKTVTIGVALFPKDTDNFWQAIKFADIALYRGKEAGRNRVVRYLSEMWDSDSEY